MHRDGSRRGQAAVMVAIAVVIVVTAALVWLIYHL